MCKLQKIKGPREGKNHDGTLRYYNFIKFIQEEITFSLL